MRECSTVFPLSFHYRFVKARVAPETSAKRGQDVRSTRSYFLNSNVPEIKWECLRYAREGGGVAALFGKFCTRNLCAESWDFIVDSVAYKVGLVRAPLVILGIVACLYQIV